MEPQKYLIHELAKLANVTVRTIRYYTDEGLLPQPLVSGKYAYYTENHLRRLELIRQMKEAYLPLREIRQALSALTDEEVQKRIKLANFNQFTPDNPKANAGQSEGKGRSAREYIDQLLEHQGNLRSPGERAPAPPPLPPSQNPTPPVSQNWQRIELAPGIELHIREQSYAFNTQTIQQIKDFIRNLTHSN